MADKKVWETKDPTEKDKKLTPKQKAEAKAAAAKAGRKYPNLVDNMNAAKKGK
jgi:ribosomal protein L15E